VIQPVWHPGAHSTSTASNKVLNYCNTNTSLDSKKSIIQPISSIDVKRYDSNSTLGMRLLHTTTNARIYDSNDNHRATNTVTNISGDYSCESYVPTTSLISATSSTNTLKGTSSSNNNTCNVLAATIPSPTSISTLAEVGSVALSVNTNKRPRQPATKNSDEHYAIVSGLQASSSHIPFTFASSTIASSICNKSPSLILSTNKILLPKSKSQADYRSKLSDADKDRIRQRETKRRAEARAASKLMPAANASISMLPKGQAEVQATYRSQLSRSDTIRFKQQNTAQRAAARAVFPDTRHDTLRQKDTSNRVLARLALPETEHDRLRQINTVQRARARAQQRQSALQQSDEPTRYHSSGELMPTNEFLNMFDKDPFAAQARFAIGSGFNAHGDVFMQTIIDSDTGQAVLSETDRLRLTNVDPLSDRVLLNAMEGFMHATDSSQLYSACSSCGITGMSNNPADGIFTPIPLFDLEKGWNTDLFGNKKTHLRTLLDLFQIEDCNLPQLFEYFKICRLYFSYFILNLFNGNSC
jgi:hypothetical protein